MAEKDIEAVLVAIKANRFDPVELFVEEADTAKKIVFGMIRLEASLGFSGSATVSQLGLIDALRLRGNKGPDLTELRKLPFEEMMRREAGIDAAYERGVDSVEIPECEPEIIKLEKIVVRPKCQQK